MVEGPTKEGPAKKACGKRFSLTSYNVIELKKIMFHVDSRFALSQSGTQLNDKVSKGSLVSVF